MNLPKAPATYDASDQAQLRGQIEREDKKNVKIGIPFGFVPIFPAYAKASLPTPARGGFIYVTDDVGGATPAFGDGTNWRRVADRAIIS